MNFVIQKAKLILFVQFVYSFFDTHPPPKLFIFMSLKPQARLKYEQIASTYLK